MILEISGNTSGGKHGYRSRRILSKESRLPGDTGLSGGCNYPGRYIQRT